MIINWIIAIAAMCFGIAAANTIFLILTVREKNRLLRIVLSDKGIQVDAMLQGKQSNQKEHTSLMKKHMERMRADK